MKGHMIHNIITETKSEVAPHQDKVLQMQLLALYPAQSVELLHRLAPSPSCKGASQPSLGLGAAVVPQ
jgi:hypothetical protein